MSSSALTLLVASTLLAMAATDACAEPAPAPNLQLTPAQWRQDLATLAAELPKRHLNAFHATTRPLFEAAVASLDHDMPGLDGDQVFVRMEEVVRLIGDGHTGVVTPEDNADLPLRLRRFGNEWRVIQAAAGAEAALGARVVAIGGAPVADAHARLLPATPSDETDDLRDALADRWLTEGIYLHGAGITPDRGHADFTLERDDGRRFHIVAAAMAPGAQPAWQYATATTPLAEQHPDDPLWCTRLAAGAALYCDFRSYKNLAAPAAALRDALAKDPPQKLIIDLRQNGGGDYFVGLIQLVGPIKSSPLNAKGRLFVLIGVRTFSAAMSNAAHFRQMTAAILIGEPIGERPNSYQENREFTLPNSQLVVSYSTRFYKFVPDDAENRIRPDIPVTTTWADYAAGRDPALQRALDYPAGG